jgi:hypothetical protein
VAERRRTHGGAGKILRQWCRWLALRQRGGALDSDTKLENVLGFLWGKVSPHLFYLYIFGRLTYTNTKYVCMKTDLSNTYKGWTENGVQHVHT